MNLLSVTDLDSNCSWLWSKCKKNKTKQYHVNKKGLPTAPTECLLFVEYYGLFVIGHTAITIFVKTIKSFIGNDP